MFQGEFDPLVFISLKEYNQARPHRTLGFQPPVPEAVLTTDITAGVQAQSMLFLDLDLDFFLNKNAYSSEHDGVRLGLEYKPWSAFKVRHFLEYRCGLSTNTPLPGRTVESHDGILNLWSTLIESGDLRIPFEVIHVDAHPDMWAGGGLY